jgi:hypothetical protein
MNKPTAQATWRLYLDTALPKIRAILKQHQYSLSAQQPHIQGERFLMQALTTAGGKKVILLGMAADGTKVVIKATNDAAGKAELHHERICRQALHNINFAYDQFHSPLELAFLEDQGYTISIQKYIEQDKSFLERSLEEQFCFSLRALQVQEGARATTKKHFVKVARIFGHRSSADYLNLHAGFLTFLKQSEAPEKCIKNVTTVNDRLQQEKNRLEQYGGFLTHTDFVPHNFRINDHTMYLLDFSSLRFGNKHESWARFLNFMTLYNPELERLLIAYVENNRASEERESLQLIRLFRLGEIIAYYTKTLKNSTDALATLNKVRVNFWNEVLAAELTNQRVSVEIVADYQKTRDQLRSPEEKERQVGLH